MTNDEPDTLTLDDLIENDLEDFYSQPSTDYASYFTLTDRGVFLAEPEHRDTTFEIRPETVPFHGTASIDFFYGRPVLYMFEPESEEPQYVIAFPTENDPHVRTAKRPGMEFNNVLDKIENDEY